MSLRRRLALTSLLAAACGAAVATRSSTRPVRLMFTGDILLSRQVQVEMARTHASPFDSVARVLSTADFVAGNLEGAIGSESSCIARDSSPCFADSSATPALLRDAGFRVLSVENNHAGDLGPTGRGRTIEQLRSSGLLGLDFAHSPRFARVGDVTVALIAVTTIRAADGEVQPIPSLELEQKLRLARALANLVVVSVHWGTELQDWTSDTQRADATWLVEHGADLVVGHHPHVVQELKCVHGRPVYFSLGNHVFDQRYPETKEGLIADCSIWRRRLRCGGIRTHVRRGSAVPVATSTDAPLSGCTVDLHESLTLSGISLRGAAWTPADSGTSLALEGWEGSTRRWRTRPVAVLSLEGGLAGREPLLFALERHPSPMDHEDGVRPHVYAVHRDGMVARWRGTALAWPLLDAVVDSAGFVCALHRGDSFVAPNSTTTARRVMRYQWNGFGFSAASGGAAACATMFEN